MLNMDQVGVNPQMEKFMPAQPAQPAQPAPGPIQQPMAPQGYQPAQGVPPAPAITPTLPQLNILPHQPVANPQVGGPGLGHDPYAQTAQQQAAQNFQNVQQQQALQHQMATMPQGQVTYDPTGNTVRGPLAQPVAPQGPVQPTQAPVQPPQAPQEQGPDMTGFQDEQHYGEYMGAMTHLVEYLRSQYSDQEIPHVLDGLESKVRQHGGDELVARYKSDPSMLSPEMVMPYLEGSGVGNPYQKYMEGRRSAPASNNPYMNPQAPQGHQGSYLSPTNPVNHQAPAMPSLEEVDAQFRQISDLSNPNLAAQYGGHANWQQQRLNLAVMRNKLLRQR